MLLKFFWFPVLWTLLIIGAHAIPGHELPKPFWDFFQFDKIAHFMMFSILTFSWLNGIMKQSTIYKLKVHGPKIVLAFSLILGLVLETLQNAIFVNRSFQWADVIADGAGGVVGIMIFYAIYGQVLKYTL